MSLFVGEMTKGPETMAFVEEKNEAEEVEDVGESISGGKESEAKQKLRERAATERWNMILIFNFKNLLIIIF